MRKDNILDKNENFDKSNRYYYFKYQVYCTRYDNIPRQELSQ